METMMGALFTPPPGDQFDCYKCRSPLPQNSGGERLQVARIECPVTENGAVLHSSCFERWGYFCAGCVKDAPAEAEARREWAAAIGLARQRAAALVVRYDGGPLMLADTTPIGSKRSGPPQLFCWWSDQLGSPQCDIYPTCDLMRVLPYDTIPKRPIAPE